MRVKNETWQENKSADSSSEILQKILVK